MSSPAFAAGGACRAVAGGEGGACRAVAGGEGGCALRHRTLFLTDPTIRRSDVVAPATLRRLVWVTAPAALYLISLATRRATDGAIWEAGAFGALAIFVGAVGAAASGIFLRGWRAAIFVVMIAIGTIVWIAGRSVPVRALGFALVMATQGVGLWMLHGLPTDAPATDP